MEKKPKRNMHFQSHFSYVTGGVCKHNINVVENQIGTGSHFQAPTEPDQVFFSILF